jgi:hypothetical protein
MDPEPQACPACSVAPVIKDDSVTPLGPFYVACSNELDCPVWPIGISAQTKPDAIANWNAKRYVP